MAGMTQKRALKALFLLWSLENRIYGIKTKILRATLWKEILHVRWNERHLSAYFETLITQL